MNELNVGVVVCESMHKAIEECVASMEGSFKIYPIIPSCTFTVDIDLFRHYLDRATLENEVTLLAYGTCHPQLLELLAEYDNRVVKVKGNNCFEMFLGVDKYADFHNRCYWMLNEPFFTKWKKEMFVGYGANTINGKMLIQDAYKKLVYLRFEKDQLDINLVEDFADAMGLEYEIYPTNTTNLQRLLEEALALASPTRRPKLPDSSLKYPYQSDVHTILENIGEIIYRIDIHTKEFTFISPQVESILGYTQVEFMDIMNNHVMVPLYHEDEREKVMVGRYNYLVKCLNEGMQEPYQMEHRMNHKNGDLLWIRECIYPTYSSEGDIESFVGKIVDITERKRAEEALRRAHNDLEERVMKRTAELEELTEELKIEIRDRQQVEKSLNRLNRAYLMVCECNQELIRITDEKSLLDKICRIIIETGGHRLVWVGFAEHDDNKTVRPVASTGYEKGYLEKIHITWADEPEGRGPTGTAIRTGKQAIAKNITTDPQFAPWRSEAVKRGYASSIALPLRMGHKNIGALNIYAKEPDAFDDDEVSLLIKLADNLAYGIKSLRMRTERDQAGQALMESEELYRTLVETAPDGVCMNDPEGRLIYVSQRTLELFGYEHAEELIGRNVLEFIVPDEHEKAIRNIRKTLEEGSIREEEITLIRKNGTHFIGGINATLLKDTEGQPMVFIVTTRDITERKKMEGALRELEQMLRGLYENTTEGIFRVTQDGKVIYANEAIARMFGYDSAEEFLKINIANLYPKPEDRQEALSRYEAEDHIRNLQLCLRRTDGSELWVEENATVVRDNEGNIKWYEGFMSDITARKQAEEKLKELSEQFQNLSVHLQSVREKERTGIAREIHDELGQALTALQIDLFWLRDKMPGDKEDIIQKVNSMSYAVNSLIESTQKISTELRPVLLDTLGLSAAIEWQVDEFQKRTGIHCEVIIDAEDTELDPDRSTAIFRVLQESLTNVSRHAEASEIRIRLNRHDKQLMLEVNDNGKGIAQDQISNSMAFGLIGMRERIRPWGGDFDISGIKGKGTRVTASIPLES